MVCVFTYIPATRGVLNFIGTACSVATGWAVLFRVGFTIALGLVGSACVIFVVGEKKCKASMTWQLISNIPKPLSNE